MDQGLTVEDILKANVMVMLNAVAACDDVLIPNSLVQRLGARAWVLGSYRHGDGIKLRRRHLQRFRRILVWLCLCVPFLTSWHTLVYGSRGVIVEYD